MINLIIFLGPPHDLQVPPNAYIRTRSELASMPEYQSSIIDYNHSPTFANLSTTCSNFLSDSSIEPISAVENSRSSLIAVAI
jgi:hypothetical protein